MTTWRECRSSFCHQWLTNNYLNQLRYWVSEMEATDDDGDVDFEEKFVNKTLKQWEHRSIEAAWIVDNAVENISPKHLFEQMPLCQIPAEVREPVADACHQLWLQRTAKVRLRAEKAKRQVDLTYRRLIKCLSHCSVPLTAASTRRCTPLAIKFEAACNELKEALEILPKCAHW
ncbi:hypothetical protein VN12_24665 [Pirellula sp. SH-Sr6A]|uniref:hypothetical protein n=1 Tax=Pirellula sp. SH-Sr6A TaxID=1632865 RepID=UPI00078D8A90|nr:hypothetical protein [Pirellula sp. SH-Sr6A]AMV35342.1 hypothetical protein VN12_24665 [Pirellula sp. SH-Sr6A]